jgi:tRNA-modifying protein YgfZ
LKQDSSTGYDALRTGAGLVDRSHTGRLLVVGADRRSYLQGLLTNDIEALSAGTGCYTALLTAQGRMITDMRVTELGDAILLDVPASLVESIGAHLNRFVFSEDVQVRDVTAERGEIGLYGPAAAPIATRLLHPARDLERLAMFDSTTGSYDGGPITIIRSDDAGVPGFDLIVDAEHSHAVANALEADGAVVVDSASAEAARIEAGRPRFGIDMDTDTIPLEAGIEDRAISRTKGCYVGQEVIVRVLDRGHGRVARRLMGLSCPDQIPAAGSKIMSGEREIGRVTSASYSPALGHPIALGYVQRDFTAPGTQVTIAPGINATVASLPFVDQVQA